MKIIKKLLYISFIFVINTAYSNTINGITISDELFYKLCEYRSKLVADNAAGGKRELDISVCELNSLLKSAVKYDALHYCPFCKVNYPISSDILKKVYNKNDVLCLDGLPEISNFILPPECPFCRGVYPDIIQSNIKFEELKYFILSSAFDDLLHDEICDRYFAILNELLGLDDLGKYNIYIQYAKSNKVKNTHKYLQKASFYLQQYLNEQENASNYVNFELKLANIDLLRQLGDFDSAKVKLDNLRKHLNCNDSYDGIVVALEEHLISDKHIKSCLKPIGNKLHIAIAEGINPESLKLSKTELFELEGQLNYKGQTGFVQAVEESKPEWIKYIACNNKGILFFKDSFGNTVLHISARSGNLSAVKLLLNLGSNIDELNCQKQSPLYLAIRYGHFAVVDYLLRQGANPFLEDYKSNTALQLACFGKNIDGKRILNRLLNLHKAKQDNFEETVQKCYKIAVCDGCLNYYLVLQKTGIKMNFANISNSVIKKEFIPIIAKEKGADEFLSFDFCFSKAHDYSDKLELYKATPIYDKLLAKYEY